MNEINENDIIISGISGRFPESDNIEEFWNNLVNGVEMSSVDDRRWPVDLIGLPPRTGKIKNIEHFDADFFGVTANDANYMDPQFRILHEVTYEAIWDAGIIPDELRGSSTALLVGFCYDNTTKALQNDLSKIDVKPTYGASQVASFFDFRGPSFSMDTACASSFSALNEGIRILQMNQCENVVVGGVAIHLIPAVSKGFSEMRMISIEGRSKCLDASVDGYCRSETVAAVFIQKRKNAKRIYASILTCKTNADGFKPEGITFPGFETQRSLLRETLLESNIDPLSIDYIEAHVTGTAAGDPVESRAILEAYRGESKKPILFGCLKSNMGHTEGASTNCSITKVALILQKRCIPPNINFKNPNPNIEGLMTTIIPVIQKRPFDGDIIPVNSFGFGGVNVHALLKANEKTMKDHYLPTTEDECPRLVNVAGRTADGVSRVFEWFTANRNELNAHFFALLNDVSKVDIRSGMQYRGYCLLDNCKNIIKSRVVTEQRKRPLWFVFSALGCQWKAMGKHLLRFAPFKRSIEECARIVNELSIDLIYLITDESCDVENNIVNAILAITCMQLALVDILTFVGMKPDGIIGHSLGEVAAGYADGCITIREAIFTAYFIAKCSRDAQKGEGMMAAVGLSWDEAVKRCPPGVYPGCDNFDDTVSVTGEKAKVSAFVEQLQEENVFAKKVQSCAIAFHSSMVHKAYKPLVDNISSVIISPKKRSHRWITSSAENEEDAMYCNAQYYANNVVSSVKFKQSLKMIPKDACVVEVGPHALLLAIVRRHINSRTSCISMMKKQSKDSVVDVLSSIGDIYGNGHNPQIEKMYPKVVYPVPRETASLSQLLQWNHSQNYFFCKFPEYFNFCKEVKGQKIDLIDHKMKFLEGHCIDGRNLFPATGYLYYVWNQLALMRGFENVNSFSSSIEFRNVRFHRALIIPKVDTLYFNIEFVEETGKFYVIEGDSVCVSGYMFVVNDKTAPELDRTMVKSEECFALTNKDIYKELRIRGYDYGLSFQGLTEAKSDGSFGKVKWTGHWISFTDSMLHLSVLASKERTLCVPTFIECLGFNSQTFFSALEVNDTFDVIFDKEANLGVSTGIWIKGLQASPAPRRQDLSASLEYFDFSAFERNINTCDSQTAKVNKFFETASNFIQKLYKKDFEKNEENGDIVNDSNQFLQKLTGSLSKQQTIDDFVESLTNEDKQLFMTDINNHYLISEQIQLIIENIAASHLQIIEYNATNTKYEDLVISTANSCMKKAEYKQMASESDNKLSITGTNDDIDFIVYRDVNTALITDINSIETEDKFETLLNSSYKVLKSGGFLLLVFREKLSNMEIELLKLREMNVLSLKNTYEKSVKKSRFRIISKKTDDMSVVSLLLRKIETPLEVLMKPIILNTEILNYEWVNELKQKMSDNIENRIWLKAKYSELNGIYGLAKCLRKEPNGQRIRCFISDEETITKEVLENDLAFYIRKSKTSGVICCHPIDQKYTIKTPHAYLDIKTKGDLSSLTWYESPHKYWPSLSARERSDKHFMTHNYYSALNFKDVMVATGRIPPNAYPSNNIEGCSIGMEFSGIDENGNRIFGFCNQYAISTTMMLKTDDFFFPVPNDWTLEEAATVSVVYATVYYALLIRGQLKPGETVLIHAGSGGVGQAAISVCLANGCDVYTSVSTEKKKKFLMDRFPVLKERNFVNSRDSRFEEYLMKETNGKGVDIILNSLAEEKMRASINCLADFGRFVEIGKYDIIQNTPFNPNLMSNNKSFHGVCFAHLMFQAFYDGIAAQQRICFQVKRLILNGLKNGEIKPLPRIVFERKEAENAFRYMAAGKHIGKVLLKIRDESETINNEMPFLADAIPQTVCHPSKVYIVVGGLGGIGLELAFWLTRRNARKIVITSRFGIKNVYQKYVIKNMENEGATVAVITNDATNYESALNLITESMKMGPIGGIFNLAMVLSDCLLENQTVESYEKACAPKVSATLHLDTISRKLCPNLEYFVCYSSLACGRGNAGQSNYGFANSVMESICEKRREDNLHALAVEWGAVGDVGFVLENLKSNDVVVAGTLPQRMPSCLQALDMFINQTNAVCMSCVLVGNNTSVNAGKGDLLKSICHVLGIADPNSLDENTTIAELGMDSLMAVEIKQGLERDYNVVLSTPEIRNLTVKRIREISKKKVVSTKVETESEEDENDFLKTPTQLFTRLDTNNQGVPIFFVPPIEGNYKLMKPLVKFISRPVVAINWTDEIDEMATIEDIAAFYVKRLQEEYPLIEYDLVGYSMGAVIAFEMCIQLQKINTRLVKKMINLDGALEFLKSETMELIRKGNVSNEVEAFRETLIYFISLFYTLNEVEKVSHALHSLQTKDEMSAKCSEYIRLLTNKECSPSLLTKTASRYFNKIKRVYDYNSNDTFKGDVKLICSAKAANMVQEMQKKIEGNLQTIVKQGDHKTFLSNNYEEIGNYIESQLFFIHS